MRIHLLALAVVTGCGLGDAPENPTWAEDVAPILASNCVRCHGYPATGGAPDTFRLDMYDDSIAADGTLILGAASMARFIAVRVDKEATGTAGIDTMPPDFATGENLTDRQIEILNNWALADGLPPRGVPPEGNQAPTMVLTRPLADSVVGGQLTLQYEIRDPDRDIVTGQVNAGPSFDSGVQVGPVRSGRGEVVWDFGTEAPGNYNLVARLDDGGETHDIDLGTFDVVLPDGNAAPTVLVTRPRSFDVVARAQSPFTVEVLVGDNDAGDTITLDVEAVRGEQRVTVADDVAATVGVNEIAWDTTALDPGRDWQLVVTASDGTVSRSRTVGPILLSDTTTTLTYDDVAVIIGSNCGVCHGNPSFATLPHDFGLFEDSSDRLGVFTMRGRVLWRAVFQRDMPPPSYRVIGGANAGLSESDRAMIEEWILGGAAQ